MDFKNALKEKLKRGLSAKTDLRSEEDTKRVLVVPFIEALGYDTRNPAEFLSEYSATGGSGRVDYAILKDRTPVIIVECKPASNTQLIDNRGQLRRYFSDIKPDVAILTNGTLYQFFSNLDREEEMDSTPFLEVDLGDCDDGAFGEPGAPAINALSAFTKTEFTSERAREAALALKYKRGIRRFIEQQFYGNALAPDFVELLARRVHTGSITKRVRENVGDLSKEVIKEFKDALSNAAAESSENTATSGEVEGYHIVKNILWNVLDNDRVVMRGFQSYCSIRLDDDNRNGRTICRLRFKDLNRKRVGLFDADSEEQIRIDALGEINNYAERIRQTARQILAREE